MIAHPLTPVALALIVIALPSSLAWAQPAGASGAVASTDAAASPQPTDDGSVASPRPGPPAGPADPVSGPTPIVNADGRSTTTMSAEQRRLHANGEAAARRGDWGTAARYFRASVSLGEHNLGWLSLGEALGRLARCPEAATALDAVSTSPEVPEAPARFANAMAAAQRQALGRTCPGKLVVTCSAPLNQFRLPGGRDFPCGQEIELTAGRYRLRAGPADMSISLDAWVVGVETTRVHLSLPPPVPATAILGPPPQPDAKTPLGAWDSVGWTMTGLGAAGLLVGGGLNIATLDAWIDAEEASADYTDGAVSLEVATSRRSRHTRLRDWTVGGYVAGGVLTAAGLVILLLDLDEIDLPPPGSTLEVGPTGLIGRF